MPALARATSLFADPGQHPAQELAGVHLNEHLEHPDGALVSAHTCKMGLEGIVSKRLGSRYRSVARRIGLSTSASALINRNPKR